MEPLNLTLWESFAFGILLVPQAKNSKTKKHDLELQNSARGLGQLDRVGVEVEIS